MPGITERLLQCYNRGCTQKYLPNDNHDEACWHHPGQPIFHEGYKRWSCCEEKKTTDFTDFLNFKGCTNSRHSNIKPSEPVKVPEPVELYEEPELRRPAIKIERPAFDTPFKQLEIHVADSLTQERGKMENQQTGVDKIVADLTSVENGVAIGTSCKNSACKASFTGPSSNTEKCVFHHGVPVFHEGLKFWSCCRKRTTDFDAFLEQVGCEEGNHMWFKKRADDSKTEDKRKSCRFDWHQTGSQVVVTAYAKVALPELCRVEANPVRLHVDICFDPVERKQFEMDLNLFGLVDVAHSRVHYLPTKVEISMKKAESVYWKNLEFRD